MAKVQQKSEEITAFGGIFFVLDKFDSILSSELTRGQSLCEMTNRRNGPKSCPKGH